jgi:hypothetical protein
MLGANLTVLVILLALALGLSALEPSPRRCRSCAWSGAFPDCYRDA